MQRELIHREEELKLRETALKFREEEAEAAIRAAAEFRRALFEEKRQIDEARAKDSGRKAFELAELNKAETARAAAKSQYLTFRNAQVFPLPPPTPNSPPDPPIEVNVPVEFKEGKLCGRCAFARDATHIKDGFQRCHRVRAGRHYCCVGVLCVYCVQFSEMMYTDVFGTRDFVAGRAAGSREAANVSRSKPGVA